MAALDHDQSNPENKSLMRCVIHQQAEGQQGGFPKSAWFVVNSVDTNLYSADGFSRSFRRIIQRLTVGSKILIETKAQILHLLDEGSINIVKAVTVTNYCESIQQTFLSEKPFTIVIFDLLGLTQCR